MALAGFDGELLFAEAEGRGIGIEAVLKEMNLPLGVRSRIVVKVKEALAAE